MRVLVVATKPPWPPVDGGRLLTALTVEKLRDLGHEARVVAPDYEGRGNLIPGAAPGDHFVGVARPTAWRGALRLFDPRRPISVVRHSVAAVAWEVDRQLEGHRFDVVHAEQVQALAQCGAARRRGVPVVLRCQNVESELWQQASRGHIWRAPLRLEARRMAAYEARAVNGVSAVIALTEPDVERLRRLARRPERVYRVPAPFPALLESRPRRLEGAPPLVLFGSGGWRFNREGVAWFLEAVWPSLEKELAGAVLHVFGFDEVARPRVRSHPPPSESVDAFPEEGVLLVPLRGGSGVRMKILEAWARGLPAVATSVAARGLGAASGRELLIADDAAGFVAALRRLGDPELRRQTVEAGRRLLRRDHAPERVAAALLEIYEQARAGVATPVSGSGPGVAL